MPEAKKSSMGKTASTVALLTILSKLAGLARDILVARAYGATPLADAYNFAYMFTGNILILFGGLGGPFHSATVVTLEPKKNDPDSGVLIAQILVATGVILFLIATIVFVLAPYLLHWQAGNYGSAGHIADRDVFFQQATLQLRWMSPLIVLSGLIGVTYGVLNVFNRIFWPSMSPAIASAAIIIALLVFPNPDSSLPLAIGSLIGAFGQLFAQLPDMFRCNLNYKFSLKASPELRNYVSVLWPAFVGTSIGQILLYIDASFAASCETGAWTAVMNANRLIQLPLGVLITAILVPILPRFTERAAADKPEEVKQEFFRALKFLLFISFPLTMVLIVLGKPIIQSLFQRGQWTDYATDLVTIVLLYLAPSIVIYIGRDLITRVFYAYKDSKTPYYVGMAAIVVKYFLDFSFVYQLKMGVAGIALATSLITIFNFTCLSVLLRRKIGPLGMTTMIKPVLIMLVASVVAGFGTHFAFAVAIALLAKATAFLHLIALLGTIGAASAIGMIIYTGITILCKLEEPTLLMQRLKLLPKDKTGQ